MKVRVAINDAAIEAAGRNYAKAQRTLEDALRETQKARFVSGEFRVRLAIAQVERQAGNVTAADTEFKALAKDAGAAGFNLIAKKAEAGTR